MDTEEPNEKQIKEGKVIKLKRKQKNDLSQVEMFENMTACINRFISGIGAKFPAEYRVFADDKGNRTPLYISPDKVVRYVHIEHLISKILQFTHEEKLGYGFVPRTATECAKHWLKKSEPFDVDQIKPIAELSEDCYTYCRLPWDLEDGLTPLWDEILSRMSDSKIFMAFMGSILFGEADRQQYAWLFGQGLNSKSTILKFIGKMTGQSYRSANAPAGKPSNFWTSGFIGARIVAFSDCDNHNFVASGVFKSLCGDDLVHVEFKGQNSFNTKLVAKFIVCANTLPDISGSIADKRRGLFFELAEVPEERRIDSRTLDRKLWEEGSAFLHKCRRVYMETCPNHGPLTKTLEKIDTIIAASEEDFFVIAEKYFTRELFEEGGFDIPMSDFKFVSPHQMQGIFKLERIFHREKQGKFFTYLTREWGIKKLQVRVGDIREWRYLGIELRALWKEDLGRTFKKHSEQLGYS